MRVPYLLIALTVLLVTALELLADFRPFAWVWWTHKQAMNAGGFVVIALIAWTLLSRSA